MDKIKFAVIVIIITIFVNGINCDSDCDCKSIKELQEFMKKDLYENKFEISKMNSRLRRLETSMRSFTKTNNKAPSTESGGELSTSGVNSNETKGLGSIESLEAKITAIASLLKIDDENSTDVTKTKTGITSGILDKIETKVTSLSLQVQDLKKTNAVLGKVVAKTLSAEKGSRKRFESVFTNAVENINNSVSDMKIETESLIDKNSDKLIDRFDKSFKMMKDVTVNINQTINEEINILTDSLHSLTEEWSGANKNVHGGWTNWSNWSACPVTCGIGMQKRHRNCSNPYPLRYGDHCFGDALEYRICDQMLCDDGVWGNWEQWGTCLPSCDTGIRQRFRSCAKQIGTICEGRSHEVHLCNTTDDCIKTCTSRPADGGLTNVAFRKKSFAIFKPQDSYRQRMVDGNKDTFAHTSETSGKQNPYALVDLKDVYRIHHIHIINRKDCCASRTHDVVIQVGLEPSSLFTVARHKAAIGAKCTFSFEHQVRGRYVKIMLESTEVLNIAELEVFA